MSDTLTPPEGQNSFSGIPEAQFVEDVDKFMKGEDSAEEKLKVRFVFNEYESTHAWLFTNDRVPVRAGGTRGNPPFIF